KQRLSSAGRSHQRRNALHRQRFQNDRKRFVLPRAQLDARVANVAIAVPQIASRAPRFEVLPHGRSAVARGPEMGDVKSVLGNCLPASLAVAATHEKNLSSLTGGDTSREPCGISHSRTAFVLEENTP